MIELNRDFVPSGDFLLLNPAVLPCEEGLGQGHKTMCLGEATKIRTRKVPVMFNFLLHWGGAD